MYVPKIHLRKTQALVLVSLVVIAFLPVVTQVTLSSSDSSKYWAKYELHGYRKDKSEYVIVYISVDLSDPEYPDVKATGVKVLKGNFDSTELAGIKVSAETLINYLIQIVADPNELPPNGIVQTIKYNVSVYEVYDTHTYLLKYAKMSKEDGEYIYEMKLTDTNVKPGWLGTSATTTQVTTPPSTTYTTSTGTSAATPNLKSGQYVTYRIELDIIDKTSGNAIKGSGEVKYVLTVRDGYVTAEDVKVSNVHIDKLPGETTEEQFKSFLKSFLMNYLSFWIPPNQLKTSEVKNLNIGKFKASASYDAQTGLLKNAYLIPNSEDVGGAGVKIMLIDTDVPSLKGAVGEAPASSGGGGLGGLLTAIIGAIVTTAIVTAFAIFMKRRKAKTTTYGAYGPAYPPPPGNPPPPPS